MSYARLDSGPADAGLRKLSSKHSARTTCLTRPLKAMEGAIGGCGLCWSPKRLRPPHFFMTANAADFPDTRPVLLRGAKGPRLMWAQFTLNPRINCQPVHSDVIGRMTLAMPSTTPN